MNLNQEDPDKRHRYQQSQDRFHQGTHRVRISGPILVFRNNKGQYRICEDATEEEIDAALIEAGAKEFVMNLPEGIDTEVGDRGVKLSGGQKARISLARALLTKPGFTSPG